MSNPHVSRIRETGKFRWSCRALCGIRFGGSYDTLEEAVAARRQHMETPAHRSRRDKANSQYDRAGRIVEGASVETRSVQ